MHPAAASAPQGGADASRPQQQPPRHLEVAALGHEHAPCAALLGEAHSLQLLLEGLDLGRLGLVVLLEALELARHPGIQQELPHLLASPGQRCAQARCDGLHTPPGEESRLLLAVHSAASAVVARPAHGSRSVSWATLPGEAPSACGATRLSYVGRGILAVTEQVSPEVQQLYVLLCHSHTQALLSLLQAGHVCRPALVHRGSPSELCHGRTRVQHGLAVDAAVPDCSVPAVQLCLWGRAPALSCLQPAAAAAAAAAAAGGCRGAPQGR